MQDQLERRVLLEHDDRVDHRERREHVRALGVVRTGRVGPLSRSHGRVAVHADDERVALATRGEQHVDVPGMEADRRRRW